MADDADAQARLSMLKAEVMAAEASLARRRVRLQLARDEVDAVRRRLAAQELQDQRPTPWERLVRRREGDEEGRATRRAARYREYVEHAQSIVAQRRAELEAEQALQGQPSSAPAPALDLWAQPPATRVGDADLGLIGRDLELLLAEAERYVADGDNPPELRDAVHVRRMTLLGELRLVGVEADSQTIVRAAAYLISVLAPAEVLARVVTEAGSPAADVAAIVDAVPDLSSEGLAAAAGEDIAERLDALAGPEDTARDAVRRGAHQWLENDLWSVHVNRIATAVSAGTVAAGGVAADQVTGGRLSAVLRAVVALMRARFPWIFP